MRMKFILMAFIFFNTLNAHAQFHLKITCNPDNGGLTNPEWLNNYVIMYTTDDWKHSHLLYWQATYQGYDNNGVTFYKSYWESCSFAGQKEAFEIAHNLTTEYSVGKWSSLEYQKHLQLKEKYDRILAKLNFKRIENQNCKEEIVIK